jgi:hypothetical protein
MGNDKITGALEIATDLRVVSQAASTVTKTVIAHHTVSGQTTTRPAISSPKFAYPPAILRNYSLLQLLTWYETNLANKPHIDPQQHSVIFDMSRFCYMIKLVGLDGKKLDHPLWHAEQIKTGNMTDKDFGGFVKHRAETLSWLPWIIANPLSIRKNTCLHVPGELVYVRQVHPKGKERFKLLYCDRVGSETLVPVSSFRVKREPTGEIIWPLNETEPS